MTVKTESLASRQCVPCHGGMPPITGDALGEMMAQVEGWQLVDDKRITRMYRFKDFATALAFVNRVGELADQQDHHPEINLTWGKVRIELSTHAINGLSENDFILAAKIDQLPR